MQSCAMDDRARTRIRSLLIFVLLGIGGILFLLIRRLPEQNDPSGVGVRPRPDVDEIDPARQTRAGTVPSVPDECLAPSRELAIEGQGLNSMPGEYSMYVLAGNSPALSLRRQSNAAFAVKYP